MNRHIKVAHQVGLELELHASLPESFFGLYYQEEGFQPVASLSKEIQGRPVLQRVVLAEEIGHHLTTQSHSLPRFFSDYRDTLSVSRNEYRAMRRGGELLIYPEEILDALACGIEEPWDMADHFGVTEEFMHFRLSTWKISGK